MNLSHFPHAIRDLIFNQFCPSYLIIELWKCGDLLLQSRLAHDVVEMHLSCDSILVSRYPRMISQLRSLRRLSLRSPHKLHGNPSTLQKELLMVAGTLESLKLVAPDCHAIFLNFQGSPLENSSKNSTYYDKGALDSPSDLSILSAGDSTSSAVSRGTCRYIDMETLFPRLKEWILSPEPLQGPVHPFRFEYNEIARVLPPTLTSFGGSSPLLQAEKDAALWLNLPPSLERLDLHFIFNGRLESANKLPPHLTYIRKCTSIDYTSSTEKCGLPTSLTSPGKVKISQLLIHPLYLRSLPKSLNTLQIEHPLFNQEALGALNTNWCAELPRGLKHLRLRSAPLPLFSIGDLPRELESICILGHENISTAPLQFGSWHQNGPSSWPSTMRCLNIASHYVSTSHLHVLPPSLNKLVISLSAQQKKGGVLDVSPLPTNLTDLTIYTNWNGKKIEIPAQYLKQVTTLVVQNKQPIGFTEQMLGLLPPTMTTLHVVLNNAERKKGSTMPPWRFPPALTELKVDCLSPSWFASLPSSLTKLVIVRLQGLEADAESDIFATLPKQLLHLEASELSDRSDERMLHATAFSTLKHLEYLSVPCVTTQSSSIPNLSRQLRYLDLNFRSIDSKDSSCFPPNLTFLGIGDIISTMNVAQLDWWPIRAIMSLPLSMRHEVLALIMVTLKRQEIIGSRGIGLISLKSK